MASEIKVKYITQITRFGPNGQAVPALVVEYEIGTHGPFRLELPKVEATAEEIRKLIEAERSLIDELEGIF